MENNIKTVLSEREFEIMQLVSTGLLNKEIADKLGIKEVTATKHMQHIFHKYHVTNKIEATLMFLKEIGRLD